MTKTATSIFFGLLSIDSSDKQVFFTTNFGVQSFSNPDDLLTHSSLNIPLATYEPDYWRLDGQFRIADYGVDKIGILGSSQSTSDGTLADENLFKIGFTETRTALKMRVVFGSVSNDFPDSVTVSAYLVGGLVQQDNYNLTEPILDIQIASSFDTLFFNFHSTNNPYRYVRINDFVYFSDVFSGTNIKSATLLEHIDPLCLELPYNTLEFTVHNDDGLFSVTNPDGAYFTLDEGAFVDVYEQKDDREIYMGRYYLDKWKSISDTETQFVFNDTIFLLDSIPYWGFFTPTDSVVYDSDYIIQKIFEKAEIVDYELDSSLEGIDLYGWIPQGTCREALQEVCFAIGAYVTCARSGLIRILPFELASDLVDYDWLLTSADKGIQSPVDLNTLVTGVEVLSHDYAEQTDLDYVPITFFDGNVTPGTYKFEFGEPIYALTTQGTYTDGGGGDLGPNFAIIDVSGSGTLNLFGWQYVETKKTIGIYNGSLPAGTKNNIIKIDNATLVGTYNAEEVAQRVYDYFSQRYLQKTRLFASEIMTSESALIDTNYSSQVSGIVERNKINLSGGFISDIEVVGILVTP